MPSIVLAQFLPRYVSPEEHQQMIASTPVSFSDIPPILHHKEDNVTIEFDPPIDGFSEVDSKNGSIYMLENLLVFMSANGQGFHLQYRNITLHAISRTESRPSIYCQIDEIIEDDEENMRELNIIPTNETSLQPMFEALSICASLHPDQDTSDDEEKLHAFDDAEQSLEDQGLSEAGRATCPKEEDRGV